MKKAHLQEANRWYAEHYSESSFTGSAGVEIRYSLQNRRESGGTVIIVSGRTEYIEKYREVCWDFRNAPFSTCLFDHCGQGKSGRLLADSQKGHINHFDTYVSDLNQLVNHCLSNGYSRPLVLLGYSMGAPVSIILTEAEPALVDGLILVSPMLQINTGWKQPSLVVEVFSNLMVLCGKQDSYVWGGGPVDPDLPFDGNSLTSCRTRFSYNRDLMVNTAGVALGSPTYGWMVQAYKCMRKARKGGRHVFCPTIILEASDDMVVSRKHIKRFVRTLPRGEIKNYLGARHELMMENDAIRKVVLGDITSFVNLLQNS